MYRIVLPIIIVVSIILAADDPGSGLTVAVAMVSNGKKAGNMEEMLVSRIEQSLVQYQRFQVITLQNRNSIESLLKSPEMAKRYNLDRLVTVAIDTSGEKKVLTIKMIEPEHFIICASVQEIIKGDITDIIVMSDALVDTLIERETEYCKKKNERNPDVKGCKTKNGEKEVNKTDTTEKSEQFSSTKNRTNSASSNEQVNRQLNQWNRYAVGAVLIILMMMMVTLSSQQKN